MIAPCLPLALSPFSRIQTQSSFGSLAWPKIGRPSFALTGILSSTMTYTIEQSLKNLPGDGAGEDVRWLKKLRYECEIEEGKRDRREESSGLSRRDKSNDKTPRR